MSESMQSLLAAVADVARVTGDVALSHYRSALRVEWKGDGSPVTIADRAAEAAAREWIIARFPGDALLGEEMGARPGGGTRRWFIDPIDGTRSYVRGVPLWASIIAVAEGENVLAGAIACPAAGEIIAAARGEGCWWNGARCRVSDVGAIAEATLLTTDARFVHHPDRAARWSSLAEEAELTRTWGDGFGYLALATGRAEAMIDDRVNAWDVAAAQVVVEEAGGVFTDWLGRASAFGGDAIATNAALAERIRARLGIPTSGAAHA
jgi:histidinol phosphatase-like enzyme (inositol monophosphatase family)